jgi:hypothetical protein
MSNKNLILRSQNRARGFAGAPGTELKRPGSKERMVGRDGDINANSKIDLMRQIAHLMEASEQGLINDKVEEVAASNKEKFELLSAAYEDKNGGRWAELGAYIAGELSDSADREGFFRRVLKQEEVSQGNVPRMRVRRKNATAVVAGGPGMVLPQFARDQYYYPPEFTISANIRVEHREMNQGTGDIMEDKYVEAQESIMVMEDRTYILMLQALLGMANPTQSLVGGLTPANFAYMRDLITRWNIPVNTVLMASNFWNDIVAGTAFASQMDPVSKYEIQTTGYLGSLLGLDLVTDAYRNPQLKVLQQGEMYMVGAMDNHGAYTSRGPVQSIEVNNYDKGEPARGWYLFEELSMCTFNPRSVVRGLRV